MTLTQQLALPWDIHAVDFSKLDLNCIEQEEDLIISLCAASFVESGSRLYTANLVDFCAENQVLSQWLAQHWEPEELQHGRALKTYIAHVWPDFSWETIYQAFFAEYAQLCSVELLEKTQALEMVARCVVEMGTASLYRAIYTCTNEPVLQEIVAHIRSDEVRHYKHFLHYFKEYNAQFQHSRLCVMKVIVRRLLEMKKEDSTIALRYVIAAHYPDQAQEETFIQAKIESINTFIRQHLSAEMSIKMLLKPLDLSPAIQDRIQYPLKKFAQHLFFR